MRFGQSYQHRSAYQHRFACQPRSAHQNGFAARHLFGVGVALAVYAVCWAAPAAHAQGKLDARYVVSLGGVEIGKGAWYIDIGDQQYTAAASGVTTGLLRVMSTGQGSTAARGYVQRGNLLPSSYTSSITTDKRTEELRISLSGGNVREFTVDPPTPPNPDRVVITEAHRKNVSDPMSAALLRVAGTGDPVGPEACSNRRTSIFDARMRYDLQLIFKRIEQVKAVGYEGPVVVCQVNFMPIAGHVPDRYTIKYLIAQRDMETWFAPIAGTRILVPFRISIPTPLGLGVMEATQFIATAGPARPTPASAKVQ